MVPYLDSLDLSSLDPALAAKCHSGIVAPALQLLKREGYQVKVSRSLADLAAFWQRHADQEDLYRSSAFDCAFHPETSPAQGLFLEAPNWEPVGTVWRRTIPLSFSGKSLNLKQALEGLYVFYHDPLDAPRRETCVVECEAAEDIKRCTISYGGALWIHPEHQGKGLFKAFSLLSRVLAIANAGWDYFVLLTEDKNRILALDHFPCTSYTRGVWHKGVHNWLCTATYKDAVRLAMKEVV